MVKCEVRAKRLRCRVKKPIKGTLFGTQILGQAGHTQRIAQYNPKTGKWESQSFTFPIEDVRSRRLKTMETLMKLGVKRQALAKVI